MEIEQRPAVSITCASLPGVEIVDFHLDGDSLPDPDSGPTSWEELIKVSQDQDPQFIMLADPFSFPVQDLLMGLDFAFSQSAKIGGLASGAQQQGGNALFLNDRVYRSGAIGLAYTAISPWTPWWPRDAGPSASRCELPRANATCW